MPFLREFYCGACDKSFEDLVSSSAVHSTACPDCGTAVESVMSAPRIGAYHDPNAKASALRRRSHDHTMSQLKKEPERYGFKAADRRPWNIRSTTKPSS